MTLDTVYNIIQFLLVFAVEILLFALTIVLFVLNIKTFRQHYKTGLVIGSAMFLLYLCLVIFILATFDSSAILSRLNNSDDLNGFFKYCVYLGVILGIGLLFVKIGWHMMIYSVAAAEWSKIRANAFQIFRPAGPISWRPIAGAAIFGVAAAIVSLLVFDYLGVKETDPGLFLKEFTKGIKGPVGLAVLILALMVPSVMEELAYRGVLLGFLLRLSKDNRILIAGSTVLVALFWSIGHIYNTDTPSIKCLQIFIIGIVLSEFVRRSSIESAIIGHVCLNTTCVVIYFIQQGLI